MGKHQGGPSTLTPPGCQPGKQKAGGNTVQVRGHKLLLSRPQKETCGAVQRPCGSRVISPHLSPACNLRKP